MNNLQVMLSVWEESLDGIVITDANTNIMDVNPAYCTLTGFRRADLIGKRTNVIGSGLTARAVFDEMWHSLQSTGKWVGDLINRRPDGSLWISFLSITRVKGPDEKIYFVGLARDLTERRHLEEQLRQQSTRLSALLNTIEAAVIMLDPEGRCIVVNQRLTQLLGGTETDYLDHTRAELQMRLSEVLVEPDILAPTEGIGFRVLSSTGPSPRYSNHRWGPVVSANGVQLGQIFTFRDVTRETEVDRMKSEFTATVSHELRTPMTSIKGALGLLLGGAAGPVLEPQRELLTIAQSNIDRLIRLINDILDLSKIDSRRLELRLIPVNVNDVVAGAVREMESISRTGTYTCRQSYSLNSPRLKPTRTESVRC